MYFNDCLPRLPFNGNLAEINTYHVTIVDTTMWVNQIRHNMEYLSSEFYINRYETEILCWWCITESVKRGFPELRVLNHNHVDKYEQVYDSLFTNQEFLMRNSLLAHVQGLPGAKCIRVLPLLDKTVIALGI